jgi:antitoxin component of MazEF toxin-antitoxin module
MGVRLPAHMLKSLGIEEGTEMEITCFENQITLRPIEKDKMEQADRIRKQYLDLLSKAEKDSQRHQEIEFGLAGREEI